MFLHLSPINLKSKFLKHSFLIIPQYPIPLLGQDLLKFQEAPVKSLKIMLANKTKLENNIPKQILQKAGPLVWNSGVPGKAKAAQPVQICLRPGTAYPHKKQCPIKQEALKGLQLIIEKFATHGLLVPCQPPCSTLIVPVLTLTGLYRLVQDLNWLMMLLFPSIPLQSKLPPYSLSIRQYSVVYSFRLTRCLLLHPCPPRFLIPICMLVDRPKK